MAEATDRPVAAPDPLPAPMNEPSDYRPISGWAIASLLVTGVYVVVIVVGGGIALYRWSPYLLPLWTLVLPLMGLALALFAQAQIRRAEGTRAGHGLARASWWTCLLLGAIYLSFYASTFMAVRQQADNFVRKWFDQVKAGNVNEAFLLTQHPEKRLSVSAQDENMLRARFDVGRMGARGELSMFRGNEMIHLIQQGGQECRIEAKGVTNWQFTEGSYEVTRTYQVITPEGDMELTITTRGAESRSRAYDGRQWYLFWDSTGITRGAPTPFGERILTLRAQGAMFLELWRQKILRGTTESLESAYLDTQPPAEREAKGAAYREGKLDLKEFVNAKQFKAENEATRKVLLDTMENLFRPRGEEHPQFLQLNFRTTASRRWEQSHDRIRFTYDGDLLLAVAKRPVCKGDLALVIESEPGAVAAGKSATWRLRLIEPIQAVDPLNPANQMRQD